MGNLRVSCTTHRFQFPQKELVCEIVTLGPETAGRNLPVPALPLEPRKMSVGTMILSSHGWPGGGEAHNIAPRVSPPPLSAPYAGSIVYTV